MRTLKKTLCLVLCLAMMAGLCVFASADFKDQDKIENTEAVTILTGLGVIQGDEKGNFNPQGTLTRAEAATILTKVLGGDGLAITTDKFTDVKEGDWYMPYVAYCVAEGAVAGMGDGTFAPNKKLTGYEWATMLLRALGYEIAGETWQIDVAKLVKSLGLMDGFVGTKEINRDDACQMAYNAINVAPDGETKEFVVTDKAGKELYRGTNEVIAYLTASKSADNEIKEVSVKEGSLGKTNFSLTEATSTDAFGRTSKIYTNGKKTTDKDYKVYASFAPTAVATYTEATTKEKLAAALGATTTEGVSLTIITNGKAAAAETVKKASTATAIGGQGTLIEVYKTGDKAFKVVVVDTYVYTLGDKDVVAAKAATAKADAVEAHIKLKLGLDTLTYPTDSFKKGDVVLFTVSESTGTKKVANVVKADAITGNVVAVASDNSYFRIGDDKLTVGEHSNITIGTDDGAKFEKSPKSAYTYYLDNYGNVMAIAEGEAAESNYTYVYVIDAASVKGATVGGDSLFDQETEDSAAQVKVMSLTTGNISVRNVAIVKGTDNKFYYATQAGAAGKTEVDKNNVPVFTAAGIYKCVELDEGLVLVAANDASVTLSAKKGVAKIADGKFATKDTTLTVIEYTKDYKSTTVSTVTGYTNFPSDAETGAVNYVVADNKGNVSSIVVVKAKGSVTATVNYAVYKGTGEVGEDGTAYEFYVNGEVKSFYLAEGIDAAAAGVDPLAAGTVVSYTLTDGKLGKSAVESAAGKLLKNGKITNMTDSYVVIDGVVYTFVEGYTTVEDDKYTVSTFEVGSTVTLYGESADKVAFVVIDADA